MTLFFVLILDVIENPVPNMLKNMELSFLKFVHSIQNILQTKEQTVTKTPRPLTASSNFSQWDRGDCVVIGQLVEQHFIKEESWRGYPADSESCWGWAVRIFIP